MHARVAAMGLALAGLAACTVPPPKPPVPAGPPAGVDGRYRGTARLVHSNNRLCPRSGPRTYEVVGDSITFSYQAGRGRVPLAATIGPDGAFSANDGVGTLEGRLQDGTLEFTIASAQCEHRWTMRKIP